MKKTIAALTVLSALLSILTGFTKSKIESAETPLNHAPESRMIYASSEYSEEYKASYVSDGIVRRQDMRLTNWMTNYKQEGTLTLTWNTEQILTRVLFYDISDMTNHVEKITMTFDNGNVIEMGELVNNGAPKGLDFDTPIYTKSVNIHIKGSEKTEAVGLSEVKFFDENGNNVALNALAEADSVAPDGYPYWYIPDIYEGWYAAQNAVNGWADFELPKNSIENEWASLGESAPTIKFIWDEPIQIGTVVLVDRIGSNDWVLGGEITFDNGKTVPFGELNNYGEPYYADIPNVITNTMTVSIKESIGPNIGFAEIEVYTEHFDEDGNIISNFYTEPEEISESNSYKTTSEDGSDNINESNEILPDARITSIVILSIFAVFIISAGFSAVKPKANKL